MSKIPFPKYDEALVHRIEEHLEMQYLTEIVQVNEIYLWNPDNHESYDMHFQLHARGGTIADIDNAITPRLMIQSLPDNPTGERGGMIYPKPCPKCDDWSRSWNCPEHPEKTWSDTQRKWIAPDSRPAFEVFVEAAQAQGFEVEHQGDVIERAISATNVNQAFGLSHDNDADGSLLRQYASQIPPGATQEHRHAVLREYIDSLSDRITPSGTTEDADEYRW